MDIELNKEVRKNSGIVNGQIYFCLFIPYTKYLLLGLMTNINSIHIYR